ncbi:MAG: hypothetical protein DWQ06_00495 [Calditrichaeota bacterium]|nr:MAG: hypothetical protein DWQ06_00495 [Calditrichota bacterium]
MASFIERYTFLGFLAGFLLSFVETFDRIFLYGHLNLNLLESLRFLVYDFATISSLTIIFGFFLGCFIWLMDSFTKIVYDKFFAEKYSLKSFELKFYLILGVSISSLSLIIFNFVFKSSKDNSTFFTALFKLFQNSNTYATLRVSLMDISIIANTRLFFRETFNLEIGVILILLVIILLVSIVSFVIRFMIKNYSDSLNLKNVLFQKVIVTILFFGVIVFYYVDSYLYRNLYHVLHTSLKVVYLVTTLVFLSFFKEWIVKKDFLIRKRIFIPIVLALLVFSNFDLPSNRKIKSAIFRHTELVRFSIQQFQKISDFDGDGYSHFFDGGDSEPMNSNIHPRAQDIPNNSFDENSLGGDLLTSDFSKIEFNKNFIEEFFQEEVYTEKEIKNVLVLHVDALRNDRVLSSEYDNLLPNFKKFTKESITFSRAYAQGSGTRASIHPMRAMSYNHFREVDFNSIRPQLSPFKETLDTIITQIPFEMLDYESSPNDLTKDSDSKDVFFEIKKWLLEEDRENFLFTAFIGDTHYPHMDRGFGFPQSLVGNYDSEVKYFDNNFKEFWNYFSKSKYYQNTVVVVFADHGEELLDHGGLFHGVSLYEELIWVPLSFYIPNFQPKMVENFVELNDVYLTIFELLGVNLKSNSFRQGKSLLPLINNKEISHKNYVMSSRCYHSLDGDYSEFSIIDAKSGYKLIYNQMYFTFELFNIFSDPLEKKNLVDYEIEEFNKICQVLDLTLNGYDINN